MERDEVSVRSLQVFDAEFDLVERGPFVVTDPWFVCIVINSHNLGYVLLCLSVRRHAVARNPVALAEPLLIRVDGVDWTMTEETVHKSTRTATREAIGAYLHRIANAFERGEAAPVDDSVTVNMPAESEMEIDVERDGDELSYELEFAWPEVEGGVDTDAPADAGVPEDDDSPDSQATFELYADKASEWRWRLRHDNGNIIADSGEGYSKKANARNGIQSVKRNAAGAEIEEQD
jgi:amphi-Trp domain-containing protein